MVAVRSDSQLAFLGRIFWMMAGPACLLVSAAMIVNSPGAGWRTGADIVYGIALAGMILGRWLEHQAGSPRNAMGEPAGAGDLRRYIVVVAILGPAIWLAANFVSNHLLV
jgi:hypothetical protein